MKQKQKFTDGKRGNLMENIAAKINIPTTKAWASDIREFAEIIEETLEHIYPSGRVVIHEQIKNNGLKRIGISVREDGCSVAPIVYLEELYQEYLAGKPLAEICRIVTETSRSPERYKYGNISSFADFSVARERICYKLVNAEKNADLLKEIPHRLWQDLAVIYYILVSKEPEGISGITIKNSMASLWDVDENTLYETAGQNTPAFFGDKIMPVTEVMEQLSKEIPEGEIKEISGMEQEGLSDGWLPLYIVSNGCCINGAIAMLYDGLLEKFAGEIGGDFYILPSSIHETIFIPALPSVEEGELLEIVHRVNAGHVAPEEFLSDNVYRYHAGDGCVRAVRWEWQRLT